MSTFRYSLIFPRFVGGQVLHVEGGAQLGTVLLAAKEREPHSVLHRTGRPRAGWRSPAGPATPEPLSTMPGPSFSSEFVEVGADHHDVGGVSGTGVCAMTLRSNPRLSPSQRDDAIISRGAGLEPSVAQHADHVINTRVVAGGPGGPIATVLVGDLLQCLKVLECPGHCSPHRPVASPDEPVRRAAAEDLGGDDAAVGEDGAVGDGGGTVGGTCTAPDPQAEAARMTEDPAKCESDTRDFEACDRFVGKISSPGL